MHDRSWRRSKRVDNDSDKVDAPPKMRVYEIGMGIRIRKTGSGKFLKFGSGKVVLWSESSRPVEGFDLYKDEGALRTPGDNVDLPEREPKVAIEDSEPEGGKKGCCNGFAQGSGLEVVGHREIIRGSVDLGNIWEGSKEKA